MTGNMTSSDINFYIYLFLSKALLYHIDYTTGLSRKTLLLPEHMWLGRYILTY